MAQKDLILWSIAVFSSAAAFYAYKTSTLFSGVLVLLAFTMILFSLRSKLNIWKSAGTLAKPVFMWGLTFFLGFTYAAYQQYPFGEALIFGAGASFIGGAFSMLVFKYWHMGPH